MEIAFISTEAVPFAKTGGLGDVCGALPAALAARGHQVTLLLPAFRSVHAAGVSLDKTDLSFAVEVRERIVGARLLSATLPAAGVATTTGDAGGVQVLFIDQPQYFDRPALYGDAGGDYVDNCERFAFFCRGALQTLTLLDRHFDIVHCHDWQTGLIPFYMRERFGSHRWMERARSVFTIHNLAYQGRFWHWDFPLTGLDWEHFSPDGLEFYGGLNFLKTGILHADMITTVSPTYADEIRSELHGCGLDPLLRLRGDRLRGITNGIDDSVWNPATDRYLIEGGYDVTSWTTGKPVQKRRLQEIFGLPVDSDIPLIGLVGRLADQKGWDLIIEVLRQHLEQERPVQWVILGTGEPRYHVALDELAARFPDRFGLKLGFSDALAHQIEAGADLFLMPSRYEPCGLNQLYSLRYGTVPIVMATGGLVDTVVDATAETIAEATATGFHMHDFSAVELEQVIGKALDLRQQQPNIWKKMIETGMSQDWSWRQSAYLYEQLYADTVSLGLGGVIPG